MAEYYCLGCGDVFSSVPGMILETPFCLDCQINHPEDKEGLIHFSVDEESAGLYDTACGARGRSSPSVERIDCPACRKHPEYLEEIEILKQDPAEIDFSQSIFQKLSEMPKTPDYEDLEGEI